MRRSESNPPPFSVKWNPGKILQRSEKEYLGTTREKKFPRTKASPAIWRSCGSGYGCGYGGIRDSSHMIVNDCHASVSQTLQILYLNEQAIAS